MSSVRPLVGPAQFSRARRTAGRLRRRLRALRDALLHPWHRRRALRTLAQLPPPETVLVLCLGNVCRSPYAEVRLRNRLAAAGHTASVHSAGFIGPGRRADEKARIIALERGVDTSAHRSTAIGEAMIAEADLILLVDPSHARRLRRSVGSHGRPTVVLGDLDPEFSGNRTIRDPWGEDDDVFQRVFDRLDRCIDELVRALRIRTT